jgi:hypothetical protein
MVELRAIDPRATPEEVAAIVAALTLALAPAPVGAASHEHEEDDLHEWVRAARLRSRRAGFQRGPWRMSGRLGRRSRA